MNKIADKEKKIKEFLTTTNFSGYQKVPLPYGLAVPGEDRSATANLVLPSAWQDLAAFAGAMGCQNID